MTVPSSATQCHELRLRDFRNFAELELTFPAAGVAIIGENGSGKTNLLEAIYYLEIFRSFRGAPDEQLVRFGADAFHVRGRCAQPAAGELELAVGYDRRGRRKRVQVGGLEPDRLGAALGRAAVVVFAPSDVEIVAGAPGARRRFLDIVLSLNVPGYLTTLQRYRQVLRQRNLLLREGAAAALIAAWDEPLVDRGARVTAARARWVAQQAPGFARRYRAVAGEARGARLRYHAAMPLPESDDGAPSEHAVATLFRAALARSSERERQRGATVVGPHRDDLRFLLEEADETRELRAFGSGGQQRTAALALRMTEAETVRRARGRDPIVLLDDVFAELDPGRSRRLLGLLEEEQRGQVILTAPKATDLEPRRGALEHWRIADGQVLP